MSRSLAVVAVVGGILGVLTIVGVRLVFAPPAASTFYLGPPRIIAQQPSPDARLIARIVASDRRAAGAESMDIAASFEVLEATTRRRIAWEPMLPSRPPRRAHLQWTDAATVSFTIAEKPRVTLTVRLE